MPFFILRFEYIINRIVILTCLRSDHILDLFHSHRLSWSDCCSYKFLIWSWMWWLFSPSSHNLFIESWKKVCKKIWLQVLSFISFKLNNFLQLFQNFTKICCDILKKGKSLLSTILVIKKKHCKTVTFFLFCLLGIGLQFTRTDCFFTYFNLRCRQADIGNRVELLVSMTQVKN